MEGGDFDDFPDLSISKMSSIAHPQIPTLPVVTENIQKVTIEAK